LQTLLRVKLFYVVAGVPWQLAAKSYLFRRAVNQG